jgi:hypothetical protein
MDPTIDVSASRQVIGARYGLVSSCARYSNRGSLVYHFVMFVTC